MAEKTFKIQPGEEIEISIRRRRQDAETILGSRRKRGIIDPFAPDEFLPRRLNKQSYVEFYDLGQMADGTDNPFNIVPGVVYNGFSSNLNVASVMTAADYAAFEAIVVSQIENLDQIYKKLVPADSDPLGIAVLGSPEVGTGTITLESLNTSNPHWTANGLNIPGEDLANPNFGIGSPTFNHSFRLKGDFKYHITTEYDWDADDAVFNPSNSDKYFLLPAFYFAYALNSKTTGLATLQYLNYHYVPVPRQPAVNPENEFYGASYAGTKSWYNGQSLGLYNTANTAAKIIRSHPDGRLYEVVGSGSGWAWTTGNPAIDFNNAAYSSLYEVYPAGDYLLANYIQLAKIEKILLAIIKQGETFYFVWNFAD
jgi:hypothetical protein